MAWPSGWLVDLLLVWLAAWLAGGWLAAGWLAWLAGWLAWLAGVTSAAALQGLGRLGIEMAVLCTSPREWDEPQGDSLLLPMQAGSLAVHRRLDRRGVLFAISFFHCFYCATRRATLTLPGLRVL